MPRYLVDLVVGAPVLPRERRRVHRAGRFIPANAVWALAWALGLGLGAYAIGPSIGDLWDDFGLIGALVVVVGVGGALLATRLGLRRRRRDA